MKEKLHQSRRLKATCGQVITRISCCWHYHASLPINEIGSGN